MARRGGNKAKPRKGRAKRPIPVRSAPDGGELCLQCGLCCDGTLFANIRMEAAEQEFVESLGLEVVVHDDILGALQPCPAFVDGCCSLYQVGRPHTCGTYRCGLLSGYEDGVAGMDDALTIVRLVRSLTQVLEHEMSLPVGSYNRRALQSYLETVRPWEAPDEHARLLESYFRLDILGQKYFGYQPKPSEVAAAAAGSEVAAEQAASAL